MNPEQVCHLKHILHWTGIFWQVSSVHSMNEIPKNKSEFINPIPMGLIFDYFLWGGKGIRCPPPLKSALIELEKF